MWHNMSVRTNQVKEDLFYSLIIQVCLKCQKKTFQTLFSFLHVCVLSDPELYKTIIRVRF